MNQFDLEQGIMSCWHIVSDLNMLSEAAVEDDSMTMDRVSNITMGLEELYELKFDKLFRTFEDFLKVYYSLKKEVEELRREVKILRQEQEEIEEANAQEQIDDERQEWEINHWDDLEREINHWDDYSDYDLSLNHKFR
jgi:ribosome-binding ATPase YchF (GTP1/OBG family)